MGKKMLIIGGGISGLSAGCYAQMNGYETEIFERNPVPGGLCTSWERQGYTIDGCIHWLVGTRPGSPFFKLWQELGVDLSDAVRFETFYQVEDGDQTAILRGDLDKLQAHLCRISPEDSHRIERILDWARAFAALDFPVEQPRDLMNFSDGLKLLWSMRPFVKTMRYLQSRTIEEECSRMESDLIRRVFTRYIPEQYSMTALVSTLASLHKGDAGFPRGGSKRLAEDMAQRYRQLGGALHCAKPVKRIAVRGDRAVGIKLEDGSQVSGDLVVSSVDAHFALEELLEGKYTPPEMRRYFRELPTFTSAQISFGINANLCAEPHTLFYRLPEPMVLAGVRHKNMGFRHYCYDPSLTPAGKTLVTCSIFSDYDHWQELKKDGKRYQQEKERLAAQVQEQLEARFPKAKGNVEMVDVATPLTYQRYTNVWRGSYMGFVVGPKQGRVRIPWELPEVGNLFLIGQWFDTMPGLPGSMLTGRYMVQRLCRREERPFFSAPRPAELAPSSQ